MYDIQVNKVLREKGSQSKQVQVIYGFWSYKTVALPINAITSLMCYAFIFIFLSIKLRMYSTVATDKS